MRFRLLLVLVTSLIPRNILFVLSDEHSNRFIHCYGREEIKTPNFDAAEYTESTVPNNPKRMITLAVNKSADVDEVAVSKLK